jgi:hypothetical protein
MKCFSAAITSWVVMRTLFLSCFANVVAITILVALALCVEIHYLGAAIYRIEIRYILKVEFLEAVELTLQHVCSTHKAVKVTGVKIEDKQGVPRFVLKSSHPWRATLECRDDMIQRS